MTATLFRRARRLGLSAFVLGALCLAGPAAASSDGKTAGGDLDSPRKVHGLNQHSPKDQIVYGGRGHSRRAPRTTGPRDCQPVRGTFTNQFLTGPANCPTSPVALCTEGQLSGDLEGEYDFVFLTNEPVSQGTVVPIDRFTGESTIVLDEGTIVGRDFGILRAQRFPLADFTTHLRITSGTGAFEGASGQLTIQGLASFITGQGEGTYVGVICVPK